MVSHGTSGGIFHAIYGPPISMIKQCFYGFQHLFNCDQVNSQLIRQVHTLLIIILDVQPASTHLLSLFP